MRTLQVNVSKEFSLRLWPYPGYNIWGKYVTSSQTSPATQCASACFESWNAAVVDLSAHAELAVVRVCDLVVRHGRRCRSSVYTPRGTRRQATHNARPCHINPGDDYSSKQFLTDVFYYCCNCLSLTAPFPSSFPFCTASARIITCHNCVVSQ